MGIKDDGRLNKRGETVQEARRRYNRKYYGKNKERLRDAQKARQAARRRAERERQANIHTKRLETLAKARSVREGKQQKWDELGRIVARMNLEAGLSQKEIYRILQGLTTKREIAEWVARGKKTAKLKRPKSNSSDG
jgi:hypothetical protein